MKDEKQFEQLLKLLLELRKQERIHITMQAKVDVQIVISNPGGGPLVIDATGVPGTGVAGQPYNGLFKVSGGQGPYSWSDTSSNETVTPPAVVGFPTGTTLNSDGSVTGTPATSIADGTAFEAEATVTDANGQTASVKARFGNR